MTPTGTESKWATKIHTDILNREGNGNVALQKDYEDCVLYSSSPFITLATLDIAAKITISIKVLYGNHIYIVGSLNHE